MPSMLQSNQWFISRLEDKGKIFLRLYKTDNKCSLLLSITSFVSNRLMAIFKTLPKLLWSIFIIVKNFIPNDFQNLADVD